MAQPNLITGCTGITAQQHICSLISALQYRYTIVSNRLLTIGPCTQPANVIHLIIYRRLKWRIMESIQSTNSLEVRVNNLNIPYCFFCLHRAICAIYFISICILAVGGTAQCMVGFEFLSGRGCTTRTLANNI